MSRSTQPQIRYYQNEQTDDFSGIVRTPIPIDASYRYLHKSPVWHLAECLVYRVIMTPLAALWCRVKYRVRIVGKEKLRQSRKGKTGCFLYGNHTLMDGDAFLPSVCAFPQKTAVVVSAENLSVPLTKPWIELCGAIPVPNAPSGARPFLNALKWHIRHGHAVTIYPEAHLWPYCTFIRSYPADSFRYPIRLHAPAFAMTVVHQAPASPRRKHPNITVYLDGPFYADPTHLEREQAQELRDRIHAAMVERAKGSNYEKYRYLKKETEHEQDPDPIRRQRKSI